jgi:hypothetical protein
LRVLEELGSWQDACKGARWSGGSLTSVSKRLGIPRGQIQGLLERRIPEKALKEALGMTISGQRWRDLPDPAECYRQAWEQGWLDDE